MGSIQMDILKVGQSIAHFTRLELQNYVIMVPVNNSYRANSADPGEMSNSIAAHSGLHWLSIPFMGFKYRKGF